MGARPTAKDSARRLEHKLYDVC